MICRICGEWDESEHPFMACPSCVNKLVIQDEDDPISKTKLFIAKERLLRALLDYWVSRQETRERASHWNEDREGVEFSSKPRIDQLEEFVKAIKTGENTRMIKQIRTEVVYSD